MSRKWGTHPSFPNYRVYEDGTVVGRWNQLVGGRTEAGYLRYRMTDGTGRSRKYMASRLVLETFGGPPPFDKAEAAHLNGDNRDDRLENLAWKTRSENMQDKLIHGTELLGERCPLGKLTDEQSDQAFEAWRSGKYTLKEIGDRYGVTAQAIWYLKDSRIRRASIIANLTMNGEL